MNNKTLTRVALRYHAVFLDINRDKIHMMSEASVPVMAFVATLKEKGFCGPRNFPSWRAVMSQSCI